MNEENSTKTALRQFSPEFWPVAYLFELAMELANVSIRLLFSPCFGCIIPDFDESKSSGWQDFKIHLLGVFRELQK